MKILAVNQPNELMREETIKMESFWRICMRNYYFELERQGKEADKVSQAKGTGGTQQCFQEPEEAKVQSRERNV